MKCNILTAVALAAAMTVTVGCVSQPGAIMDKTKPIDQNGYTVVGKEVSATEFQAIIFGIPLADLRGSPARRMYKACLDQAPDSDALIEYVTDTKAFSVPLIPVALYWYTLTGTPVKTTNVR